VPVYIALPRRQMFIATTPVIVHMNHAQVTG
jgi:hypothetical protein